MSNTRDIDATVVGTGGAGDAVTPAVANYDPYTWSGGASGAWGDAANWTDSRTGKPNGVPGATNNVTISTPSEGPITVTGTGDAHAIDIPNSYGPITIAATLIVGTVLQNYARLFIRGGNGPGGNGHVSAALWREENQTEIGDGASLQAKIAVVNPYSYNFGPAVDTLDAGGTLEIGSGGAPVAGVWTIDANGQFIGSDATLIASSFLIDGRFLADGYVALENHAGGLASVAGNGQLDIGAGGALRLGEVSATNAVYFRNTGGVGGTLALDTSSFDAHGRFDPYVRGFGTLDTITVTGLTFDGAIWSRGTLSLVEGATTVGSILLPGTLSGDTFTVNNGTITAHVEQPGTFEWIGGTAGVWGVAANWLDEGTGKSDGVPGTGSTVVINDPEVTLTGSGSAAAISGNQVTLDGTFNVGSIFAYFDVGSGGNVTINQGLTNQFYVFDGGHLTVNGDYSPPNPEPNFTETSVVVDGANSTLTFKGTFYVPQDSVEVSITNGATLQAASANIDTTPYVYIDPGTGDEEDLSSGFSLDASSVFEVGTANDGKAGAVTVDSGATLFVNGEVQAPRFVDNGTIYLGDFIAPGPFSGDGLIVLSGNLYYFENYGSGLTIQCTGSNAIFVTPSLLVGPGATITDFDATDVLGVDTTVTRAAWSGGTLGLYDGTTEVAALRLSGNYAGDSFSVQQTGTASADITLGGTLTWTGGTAGVWSNGANWLDGVTGMSDHAAGAADTAVFQNDATVTGTGTASVLELSGYASTLSVAGHVSVDRVKYVGASDNSDGNTIEGAADALAGGVLTVGTASGSLGAIGGGHVQVTGSSELDAVHSYNFDPGFNPDNFFIPVLSATGAGSVIVIDGTLVSNSGSVSASDGGTIEASSINLNDIDGLETGFDDGGFGFRTGVLYTVDSTSALEAGLKGGAAPGSVTVDAGAILSVTQLATLSAPTFIDNGTIEIGQGVMLSSTHGTTTTPASISGSGTVDIEAGATLGIVQGSSALTIAFLGTYSALSASTASLDTHGRFDPTLTGFAATDSIAFAGASFTKADWANGVLTLLNGTTAVAAFNLAGNYAGDTFSVSGDLVTLATGTTASTPHVALAHH